ncbi:MAG: hypothetical protein JW757_02350 [Anaerolineales bacterium]|nr:hypothetical protein [Anaerolineales bacterium]
MRKALYRLDQFRRAHLDKPTEAEFSRAGEILSPQLFELFSQMMPFEQAHAIRVMDRLVSAGYQEPDLLAAALLHDLGKVNYQLRPWERGLAVLAKRFFPNLYHQWSTASPAGIRAGMVVAARHAEWGAAMVEAAGANPRVVWLIANHDADLRDMEDADRAVLSVLQAVDAAN